MNRVTTRTSHRALLGLVGLAATAALLSVGSLPAMAATDTGSTDASVEVTTAISLTGLTDAFTLTGAPGDTVAEAGVVTFNVRTNNASGYIVTAQAATPTLVAAEPGNVDSIPIAALSVREGAAAFAPMSSATAVPVHSQATKSDELGDELSNDYQVVVPFVNSGTYTATLNYIASTQ